LLEPFFANLGKRLVKAPKIYLAEPGLLCFLLGVSPDNWNSSPFVGAIWETFVLAELRKYHQLYHPEATLFFYRDQQNKEVDFLWSRGGDIVLLQAKWTEHPQRADTGALEAVSAVFAKAHTMAYRVRAALVICRTLDPFVLASNIRAVNGFHLQEIVAGL
jgi:predicted AAA+ superfamily ATPase